MLLFPTRGDGAPVSLEYFLGFQGYFQLDTWTPLTVALENQGRALHGQLEVIVTSGSEFVGDVRQTPFVLDVDLPYNSSKLCSFTIPIETFTHELLIQLRQEQKVILSESINLRPHYTQKPLAVVVDDKTSPDFLSVLPDDLAAVNVRPRYLPETWFGYDGVELLIINAQMLQSLRDRQFQALQDWIMRGGSLVTAGGVNYGALSDRRTARLLPLQIKGLKQVTELASLQQFCGYTLSSPDPFLILDANMPDASVIVQEHSLPIIQRRTLGAGNILFLAFDFQNPLFSRWPHRPAFWQRIRALLPQVEREVIQLDPREIGEILLTNMPLRFPKSLLILGFLVIYTLTMWILFRQIGKQRERQAKLQLGLFLLLLMTIFSLLSYVLFFRPQLSRQLSYNSFLHLQLTDQQKIAFGQYLIGLYSLNPTMYQVQLGNVFAPINPILLRESDLLTPQDFRLYEQESQQYITGALAQWTPGFFETHTALEFPMTGQARSDNGGIELSIHNMSSYTLDAGWGYYDNRLFPLGTIAADATLTLAFSQTDLENALNVDDHQLGQIIPNIQLGRVSSALQKMQKDLFPLAVVQIHSQYQDNQEVLYVFGWIPSGLLPAHFTQSGIAGDELTLLTWEIPVTEDEPDLSH